MKTKELEKYPLQILMMTLTSFLTLLIPKLLSYLIDDILMANNKEKILPWFMITFGVTSLLMIMKFYFITYNPIKIESTDFDWRISDDVSIYGVFL